MICCKTPGMLQFLFLLCGANESPACARPCKSTTCGSYNALGLVCSQLQQNIGCDCAGCCDPNEAPPPPSPPPPPTQGSGCFARCLEGTCADAQVLLTCEDSGALGCDCAGCCMPVLRPPPPPPPPPDHFHQHLAHIHNDCALCLNLPTLAAAAILVGCLYMCANKGSTGNRSMH